MRTKGLNCYVFVLVVSSFRKMGSKDIPQRSLFKLGYFWLPPQHPSSSLGKMRSENMGPKPLTFLKQPTVQPSGALYSSAHQRQGVEEPAMTLQLLSCAFSKNCCFSTPFLESTNCHSTFIFTKGKHKIPRLTTINMARPTPAAGFAPGSINQQHCLKNTNLQAARPWDIPRWGSRLKKLLRIVRWFLCWNQKHPKTNPSTNFWNRVEDPSSPDLQQACQRFSASQKNWHSGSCANWPIC